jgi:hypothetical protein
MDIDDFIILGDFPVEEPPELSSFFKPVVNKTNLHTGVWALLHIYSTEENLTEEERDTFGRARDSLEEYITPIVLLDIFEESAGDYSTDAETMLVYASEIISINEEIRILLYAQ